VLAFAVLVIIDLISAYVPALLTDWYHRHHIVVIAHIEFTGWYPERAKARLSRTINRT
jgi:hypothetical protein